MIKSWRHKGLKLFYTTGSAALIQGQHADRVHDVLQASDVAESPDQMRFPGMLLHKLHGKLAGFWSVKVSGNWRIIFAFEDKNAILVDYLDYH